MLTLLSPSKTQDFTISDSVATHPPLFPEEIKQLGKKLQSLSAVEIAKLMKISEKLAELNFTRFKALGSQQAVQRAAILAYQGDVYQGLAAHTFSLDDLHFADEHVLILSGLYGALRPLDAMEAYRLEMGIKLVTDKHPDLYHFWRAPLNRYINQQLEHKRFLINLASEEYAKVIDRTHLNGKMIDIVFKDLHQGQYKIIGLFAKKARGLMAQFIIKNKIDDPYDLRRFCLSGYQFIDTLSHEDQFIFHRG